MDFLILLSDCLQCCRVRNGCFRIKTSEPVVSGSWRHPPTNRTFNSYNRMLKSCRRLIKLRAPVLRACQSPLGKMPLSETQHPFILGNVGTVSRNAANLAVAICAFKAMFGFASLLWVAVNDHLASVEKRPATISRAQRGSGSSQATRGSKLGMQPSTGFSNAGSSWRAA